jgi:hypothetical protein
MKGVEEFKCPFMTHDEIWQAAERFRAQYWPENALPVDTEKIVEFGLKLDIEPQAGLLSALETDAWLKRDLTGIIVDLNSFMEARYGNRLRFTMAHEIGHLILHRQLLSDFQIDSIEKYKEFMKDIPEQQYRNYEYQANEFAGRLLVPKKGPSQYFAIHFGAYQ